MTEVTPAPQSNLTPEREAELRARFERLKTTEELAEEFDKFMEYSKQIVALGKKILEQSAAYQAQSQHICLKTRSLK